MTEKNTGVEPVVCNHASRDPDTRFITYPGGAIVLCTNCMCALQSSLNQAIWDITKTQGPEKSKAERLGELILRINAIMHAEREVER